jgi:hypothetical protein
MYCALTIHVGKLWVAPGISARGLDFDYLCAKIGQEHASKSASKDLAELKNSDVGERPHD